MMQYANNPKLRTWLPVAADSDFPIQNIPFGIFRAQNHDFPRVGTIIGDTVIDVLFLAHWGCFVDLDVPTSIFEQASLNPFIALGKERTRAVRNRIARLFEHNNPEFQSESSKQHVHPQLLYPVSQVDMLLPVEIGDYTDFFSSREHATNTGKMFRDAANALLPNWLHLPVAYHGRASSIVVSGTPLHRPKGQTSPGEGQAPIFGASARVDFELEVAFIIGKSNKLGQSVPINEAEDYIFGFTLFNDWSARDIQQWEYVPLGPFLGKNFGSTMSPWVVTLDALEELRVDSPAQDPKPLPYLQQTGKHNFDIQLEVAIKTEKQAPFTVCQSNFKYMYWSIVQQLAHHTVNGCNMRIGDVCASGTISGSEPSSFGSMLELTWRGTKPIKLPDGTERKFINDNDIVILRGFGITPQGIRIGFGEASGKLLPAFNQ